MPEHVLLLHGIWMPSASLLALARRLRAAGYQVDTFAYASVLDGAPAATQRLRERLRGSEARVLHLVGHSLGGLVALEAARDGRGLPAGRIVCLGSPLRGSAVAQALARYRVGRGWLGRSAQTLVHGVGAWDGAREVGVIAGQRPLGVGAVMGVLATPHDGTVAVAETRLAGISDHCAVACTHSGLLFSAAVAERVVAFLGHGRFAAGPPG